MRRYIIKRIFSLIPLLLVLSFFSFLLLDMAPGDPVRIAVKTDAFCAGSYPASPDTLAHSTPDGTILTAREYRKQRRIILLGILLRQILLCGAALAVFLAAMHFCFES